MNSQCFTDARIGDAASFRLLDDRVRGDLMLEVYRLYGLPRPTNGRFTFPGAMPVSVERRHLPILRSKPYLVTEKTDGTRYLLLFTRYDDKQVCFLIDRTLQMWTANLTVHGGCYDGTLLDCELVRLRDGTHQLNIFDVISLCGKSLVQDVLDTRLQAAQEFAGKMVFPQEDRDPFRVSTKIFYHVSGFKNLVEHCATLKYKTDGYIFVPLLSKINTYRDESQFKWKPIDKMTVDFRIKPCPNKRDWYGLSLTQRGEFQEIQQVHMPPSILVVEVMYHLENHDVCIVESAYDQRLKSWVPLSVRFDKDTPNSVYTFDRTVLSMKQNIRLEEFM